MDNKEFAAKLSSVESDVAEIKETLAALADFLNFAKTGIKLFYILGLVCKWVSSIALGIAAIFALVTFAKTGAPPTLHLD